MSGKNPKMSRFSPGEGRTHRHTLDNSPWHFLFKKVHTFWQSGKRKRRRRCGEEGGKGGGGRGGVTQLGQPHFPLWNFSERMYLCSGLFVLPFVYIWTEFEPMLTRMLECVLPVDWLSRTAKWLSMVLMLRWGHSSWTVFSKCLRHTFLSFYLCIW